MATIQKRPNKNGSISWRVMIRQSDGYPAAYKTFPTRQEAVDWGKQEEADRRRGAYFPEQRKAGHKLEELVDRYITMVLPSKPKNAKDTKRHLTWWKQELGKYALTVITPDLIATHRQKLSVGLTPKGTRRSPSTVNRYIAALSCALSYGVKECGWIRDNPCVRLSKLKENSGRDRIASSEECQRLITACKESRSGVLLPIVVLAITTGMRQGEITRLTWNCVDLERATITLKNTKNGRPRTVAIVTYALELLKALYSARDPHNPFVFPSRRRFGSIGIRRAWDEALKRAGIKGLRFHDLRHTFATNAARAGASNMELKTAMGHQTLQMLQRYTHMDASHTRHLSVAVANSLLGDCHG